MFPIPWNFPFRKKDGTVGKIEDLGGSYVLPVASSETLGGVKIGSGISIDENGAISASGGGSSYSTFEKTMSTFSLNANEVSGNYGNLTTSDIPANADIIGYEFKPTAGERSQFVFPLVTRNLDGTVHYGFMNIYNQAAQYNAGKLCIYYVVPQS